MLSLLTNFPLLNGLALTLLVVVSAAWGRHGRQRLVLSGWATVAGIAAAYLLLVRPADLPISWITVMSHGLEGKGIEHLYGRGLNVGGNFDAVVAAVGGGSPFALRDLVWLNLLLAMLATAVFLHVALAITTRRWAVIWTLVFALNPAMFLAAFSELPTHLLALYFLAGVVGWAVVIDPLPQPPLIRVLAYGLCALLTLLATATRGEAALIGVLALALQAAFVIAGARRWAAAAAWLRAMGEWALAVLSEHLTAVGVLCVVGIVLSFSGCPILLGRGEVSGLYPFNASFLSLFGYLQLLALPVGACIAIAFGFADAVVRFRWFGGLALSLFVIVRTYFAVWIDYFEMGRYLSHVLPAILLLGVFGGGALERLASRWTPPWSRAVRIAYVMSWFTLPLPGVMQAYARPEYTREGGFGQLLLDRNVQHEVRYLLAMTEQHPECVYVARVVDDRAVVVDNPVQHGDPKVAARYVYAVFGATVRSPILVPESEATLSEVIARHAADASCVRLYFGGDCNLTYTDRCADFVRGRQLLDEHRFWSQPYNPPLKSGYGGPEIVLGIYAWP